MKHSNKLIELLQTFSASELLAFRDFTASPYFNKREELVRLYAHLKKVAATGFPDKKIERNILFEAAFPGHPYDDALFHHSMSRLLKLAEQFISLQDVLLPRLNTSIAPAQAYYRRKLRRHFDYAIKQTKTELEDQSLRDGEYFYARHEIAALEEMYFSDLNEQQLSGDSIQQASDFLDRSYLSKKLRFLCVMLDRQHFLSTPTRMDMLDEVLAFLAKNDCSDTPAISVYHALLLALTESENSRYFEQFKTLWTDSIDQFSMYDLKSQLGLAINFCIHRIRIGDKSYAAMLADLYREGLERKILLDEGRISPWTFKNIVKLNLGLQRYEWAESFVRAYSHTLQEDERQDALHFNLAELHYHQGHLDEARGHLVKVEFSHWRYILGAKTLLLKIYFETHETEALELLLTSFGTFLQRNQRIPKDVKKPYLQFVRLLHKLSMLPASQRPVLLAKIKSTPSLTERSWLEQVAVQRNR